MARSHRCRVVGEKLVYAPIVATEPLSPPLRLLGTWRSNKELTVAKLPPKPAETPLEKRAFLEDLFGKMTIRYTESHADVELNGHSSVEPYEVVAYDRNSIVLRIHCALEEEPKLYHYRFNGDGYSLLTSWGLIEYFTRVLPEPPSRSGAISPSIVEPRTTESPLS